MDVTCGPLRFTSRFDSGNLGNVQLVYPPETPTESSVAVPGVNVKTFDYEVNIWTNPDCGGTRYENGNRTWFYFGVNGGNPLAVLKLNILNLNKQTKLFEQGMQPVTCCVPEKPKWERIKERVAVLDSVGKEHNCGITFRQKLPRNPMTSTLFIAFTYPFSYSNMCDWLVDIDGVYGLPSPRSDHQLLFPSNIYYFRECVCHSLEGRDVDLITITSPDSQLSMREEYLHNLFPFRKRPRPHKFLNKKIVFLSSRVHPGEVPAQFVMNGMIKFLLDEKDNRSQMLRKLFVFKFIPILNPDGVHNGHYRTDPRGINLNRVYLNPNPRIHPSIYAARKLILYAHYGHDTPDDYAYDLNDDPSMSIMQEITPLEPQFGSGLSTPDDIDSNSNLANQDVGVEMLHQAREIETRLCAGCISLPPALTEKVNESENMVDYDDDEQSTQGKIDDENELTVSQCESNSTLVEAHQCTFESCDEDSVADYQYFPAEVPKTTPTSPNSPRNLTSSQQPRIENILSCPSSSGSTTTFDISIHQRISSPLKRRSNRSNAKNLKNDDSFTKKPLPKRSQAPGHSLVKSAEMESGLFLYVDMHGHASKRGIFMYGNHFNDISVQVECMLLPRLMSLNCQHFDFSACNFTERLMSLKDRRDGASREGSGRVAVLKLTGLIRSYTLECNYNTGRLVNHLILRPESLGFNDNLQYSLHHPPKFTPELFECAGKSLAESILDLTGVNPWSRLKYTEFRHVDGLRSFLHRRLQNSFEYKSSAAGPPISGNSRSLVNTKSRTPVVSTASTGSFLTTFNNLTWPSTSIHRSIAAKISNSPTSSTNSGPLNPKKENQPVPFGLVTKSIGKAAKSKFIPSFEKPTTSSKAKFRSNSDNKPSTIGSIGINGNSSTDMSSSGAGVSNSTIPIVPIVDTRTGLTKILKITKKKKKLSKVNSKKSKSFKNAES